MKEQTALDWLRAKLFKDFNFAFSDNIFLEAKKMEKEQMFEYIKNLYCNGDASLKYHLEEFEQYYNETFKSE